MKTAVCLVVTIALMGLGCGKSQDEHGKGPQKLHDDEQHDHAHEDESSEEHAHGIPWEEVREKQCEHAIRQIDCDACRGELGVVRLEPEVEKKLIHTQKVVPSPATRSLEFVGEIRLSQLTTVVVLPIVSGQATKVLKRLGDNVAPGDILAVLYSQEYGKIKLDYITAYQRHKLAQKNFDLSAGVHENLQQLVTALRKDEEIELQDIIARLKIGGKKEKLIEMATSYRTVKSKYRRERELAKNIRQALALLRQTADLNRDIGSVEKLPLGEWKGKLLSAAFQLLLSEKNYEREKTLMQTKASTQKEMQEAENNHRLARASYEGILEELSWWEQQKSAELAAEMDSALARYLGALEDMEMDIAVHRLEAGQEYQEAVYDKAATEKQLYLLGLTAQDIEKLSRDDSGQFPGTLEIRAPVGGTIVSSDLAEGQFVEAQRPLFTISDMKELWVWCDLYESDLLEIQPLSNELGRLSATVRFNSAGEERAGKVDYLSSAVDEKTRTVKMRVVVANNDKLLKPGMFVRVRLAIPASESALIVPADAVFSEGKEHYVFKKEDEVFWVKSDIGLGQRLGDQWEVLSGLADGDLIAVHGAAMLKSEIFKDLMGAG